MSKTVKNLPSKIKNALKPNEKSEKMDVGSDEIRFDSFHVKTDIKSRFATTVITSRMINTSKKAKEVSFTSRLPEAAFITDFCMQIGEKTVHGEVKEKKAAKETYDKAKRQGQSAGHVFQKTRETDVFTISTNVGPSAEVIFTLTYQEILQRIHGVYKHVLNLDLEQIQPTSDIQIEVEIMERGTIKTVHVPKVGPKMGEKTNADLLKWEADPNCKIETMTHDSVSISKILYRTSAGALMQHQSEGGQFVVLYDLDRDLTGGQVQVVNGYFVHFFAPEGLEVGGKHVVFVLDKSGSMAGRKMDQTKAAMRRILGDLRKQDTFNIVWFSHGSHLWKPKSVPATSDNIMKAISDVEQMYADGSTNIHDGLMDGLNLLSKSESRPLASMIVFMTDGQANAGPVSESEALIKTIAKRNEDSKFIIHTLAFGNDADFEMLQKIASGNNGLACKIHEDLDADVQLIGFYQQISSPLLADVKIEYTQGSVDLNSLVQDHTSTFYSGGEMMVLGRLNNLSISDSDQEPLIEAEISGRGSNGVTRFMCKCCPFWLPYPMPPGITCVRNDVSQKKLTTQADTDAGDFVERMWAYKTIKKLLKESQLGFWSNPEKEAKRKEALRLSLKYRFVTELTSMVVVESDLKKMEAQDSSGWGERDSTRLQSASFKISGRGGMMMKCSKRACSPSMGFGGSRLNSFDAFTSSSPPPPALQATFACSAFERSVSPLTKTCASDVIAMEYEEEKEEAMDDFIQDDDDARIFDRKRSRLHTPIPYVIIVIAPTSQPIAQPIQDEIEAWKSLLATCFEKMMKDNPKQPYLIHVIAVNPTTGRGTQVDIVNTGSQDFKRHLEQAITDAVEKHHQISGYKPIEELIDRNIVSGEKKQVWINVEDHRVADGPLADVFLYLNKVAGFEYLAKDQLE